MKFITIVLAAVFMSGLLSGCAGFPSVCDEAPESALCKIATKVGVHLESVGDVLMIVNLRAIKQGAYTKNQAIDALKNMRESYHESQFTVADLKMLIMQYVDDYPELILASRYIGHFDAPEILKTKDIEMLDFYVNQQLSILGG